MLEASPRSISSILAVRASATRASARRAACSERLFSHMACTRDLSLEVGDSGGALVPLLEAVVEGASCNPLLVEGASCDTLLVGSTKVGSTKIVEGASCDTLLVGSTKVVGGVEVGTRGIGVKVVEGVGVGTRGIEVKVVEGGGAGTRETVVGADRTVLT